MDFRSNKVIDFVSATCNMTENEKKRKAIQIRWLHDYQWLCDKYKTLDKKLDELCKLRLEDEICSETESSHDRRTCLPFPRTTSENYGWLTQKPDFKLECYGSMIVKYPNPMDEIVLLGGDVPTLAGGRGFF